MEDVWAVPPPPAYRVMFSILAGTVDSGLGVADATRIDGCDALSFVIRLKPLGGARNLSRECLKMLFQTVS